jgi:uncharacterized protein (TIGR03382 family)
MNKTATLTAVALVAALAGTAMAQKSPVYGPVQVETSNGNVVASTPGTGAGARNIVATYDFATGALDVRATAYPAQIINVDPTLANLHILEIQAFDIVANVHHNPGSAWENYASEIRLGLRVIDPATSNEVSLGAGPFPGINSGPATGPGTYMTFTGGSYGPFDITGDNYFTPASGFSVAGWATWNDGTGMPASTITGGTLRVTMVPTPGSGALLALCGLVAVRRRRR